MIEKEYYRLDDLKYRFNMTEADVLYLLEQRLVKACFYTENTNFIIGGWCKDGFVGFAHVAYQGIIALPETELVTLLRTRKVTPMNYLVPNTGSVVILSTDYGLDLNTPNDYIHQWKPTSLESINWDLIPAKLEPYVTDTISYSLYKMVDQFFKPSEKAIAVDESLKKYSNFPKQTLIPFFKNFLFSEICIRHLDLVSNRVKINNSTQIQKALPVSYSSQSKLDNEFEDLLAAIILESPQKLTAKKIHRILCDECEREEDSRLFDKNNILLGEDLGVITWRDKYRNNLQRSYNQASLGNVISRVNSKISETSAAADRCP